MVAEERAEMAIDIANEAMASMFVFVRPCDLSRVVDAGWERRQGAVQIKRGDRAVALRDITVNRGIRIHVGAEHAAGVTETERSGGDRPGRLSNVVIWPFLSRMKPCSDLPSTPSIDLTDEIDGIVLGKLREIQ